ncbi:MAG: hypothetical protein C0407_06930 [Desulfobacca sp.]|nr:hypothetical protein [Desulfobacca sp.]
MVQPILILHIDKDYQVSYWIIRDGAKIISQITIGQAISLLNSFEFDLIVFEPRNMAIIKESFQAVQSLQGEKNGDFKFPHLSDQFGPI